MEIPPYPGARPLDITDKALLSNFFAQLQPRVSELTFAGLFLFRKAHTYKLSMVNDSLVISGKGYDARSYFLPPLNGDIVEALKILFGSGLELYGADEAFVEQYLADCGLEIVEDRNSFDYLYLKDELSVLPGNRFHKKKNRIHYFANRHPYEVEIFDVRHKVECLKLLDLWYSMDGTHENSSLCLELAATAEALTMVEELGLEGVVIKVAGSVKAFALGERLNHETVVCHFEKTDPFMEGIAQLINREFAAQLFEDCKYINREQDLGESGLRNAKLSYHPLEMIKKYRARQRQDI